MNYFEYGEQEIAHLKTRDSLLGQEIDRIGMVKRSINQDVFSSLISSIISQQISTKAADTVKNKLINLIGKITPGDIDKFEVDSIQKCGMSMRKATYIKEIAKASISGAVNFSNLHYLSDKEIMDVLLPLKGVGEWTVEMLLIHCFQRPNILSYKDFGIRGGMMKLYELNEISKETFKRYYKRYSPYSTVASIYLWEVFKSK